MKKMVCTLLIGLSLIAAGAIETQIQEHRKLERTEANAGRPYAIFMGF